MERSTSATIRGCLSRRSLLQPSSLSPARPWAARHLGAISQRFISSSPAVQGRRPPQRWFYHDVDEEGIVSRVPLYLKPFTQQPKIYGRPPQPEFPANPSTRTSVGFPLETYTPVKSKELLDVLTTSQKLRLRRAHMMLWTVKVAGVALAKRSLKDFNPISFAKEATTLYEALNTAIAENNEREIYFRTNDQLFIKHSNRSGTRNPQETHHWQLVKYLEPPVVTTVSGTKVPAAEQEFTDFIHVTVRFRSEQIAYVKHGDKVVAGDPEKPREVIDHIVFERVVDNPRDYWKVIGKVYEEDLFEDLINDRIRKIGTNTASS